jgi:hypothetical protein
MNSSFIYPELSHTIIGICMKVHSRSVALELDASSITYSRKFKVMVEYNGQLVGHLIPDIVIDSKIILEVRL